MSETTPTRNDESMTTVRTFITPVQEHDEDGNGGENIDRIYEENR